MANLDQYLSQQRGRGAELARRLNLGAGTLSSIRSGQRKPSPGLAKRIEDATDGQVRATELLGLEEAGSTFDHTLPPRPLNGDRWAATVSADGSLLLTPEAVSALGFAPGERLVLRQQADGDVRVNSSDRAVKAFQDYLQKVGRPGVSLVDELIAERRAEAASE